MLVFQVKSGNDKVIWFNIGIGEEFIKKLGKLSKFQKLFKSKKNY